MFCAESPDITSRWPMAVLSVIVVRSTIGFRLSWMCPLDEQHVRSDRDIVAALEVERRRCKTTRSVLIWRKRWPEGRHHRRAWIVRTASVADYLSGRHNADDGRGEQI